MPEYVVAFRFATVLSESGTEGNGGGAVAVGVVVLLEPVRPARLLGVFVAAGCKRVY